MPGRLDIALLLLGVAMSAACDNRAELARRNSEALLERLAAAPELSASVEEIRIRPAKAAESIGMISSAAAGRDGSLYLLHRGSDADPVVAMSPDGRVLSSWGRGLFTIPHAVRIGPDGDVWTVDAGASQLRRFASDGLLRTTIEIGSRPWKLNGFRGATDLAFAADGALLIADGYGNARILEYSSDAEPVREWGKPGRGPGQFRLPHAIVLDEDGRIYVDFALFLNDADTANEKAADEPANGVFLPPGSKPLWGQMFTDPSVLPDSGPYFLNVRYTVEVNEFQNAMLASLSSDIVDFLIFFGCVYLHLSYRFCDALISENS